MGLYLWLTVFTFNLSVCIAGVIRLLFIERLVFSDITCKQDPIVLSTKKSTHPFWQGPSSIWTSGSTSNPASALCARVFLSYAHSSASSFPLHFSAASPIALATAPICSRISQISAGSCREFLPRPTTRQRPRAAAVLSLWIQDRIIRLRLMCQTGWREGVKVARMRFYTHRRQEGLVTRHET